MNQPQKNKGYSSNSSQGKQIIQPSGSQSQKDIASRMIERIDKLPAGLSGYDTRALVEDSKELGEDLSRKLKTTQIRKFLDAVNRIKAQLADKKLTDDELKSEVILLRPKLAYAAARQPGSMDSLQRVLEAAIKRVGYKDGDEVERDFNRLVQLIESIVAYHKAFGGRDQ